MNKYTFAVFAAAFLFITSYSLCADETAYNADWGIDILAPFNATQASLSTNVFLPDNGLKIYEIPSGKKSAMLSKRDGKLYIEVKENSFREIDLTDLITVGNDGFCLKVYLKTANYVQILAATRKGGYWVSYDDLKKASFRYFDWMSILQTVNTSLFVLEGQGLNLRTKPSTDGDKIVTMEGETFVIKLTGKINGNWAEAEVTEMDVPPCDGDAHEINTYNGWIKAIDDRGFPNIWYNIVGC